MDKDKVDKIIEQSGNNFHIKVVNYLREKDWKVTISPYYYDGIADKAKEIDIIADKLFPIKEHFGSVIGYMQVRFFIECKYINKEVVFWFDKKDKLKAEEKIVRDTPLKESKNNNTISSHHYLDNSEVAKIFSSNLNKEDIIFKAITQALNAKLYLGRNDFSDFGDQRILQVINYPLVLCNNFDNFYKINIDNPDDTRKIDDNFQLELNYAYNDNANAKRNEYFIIDMIDFNKFENYLKMLEDNDIKIIKETISWNKMRENSQNNF